MLEEKRMGICECVDDSLDDSIYGPTMATLLRTSMTGDSTMNGTMVTGSSYDEILTIHFFEAKTPLSSPPEFKARKLKDSPEKRWF